MLCSRWVREPGQRKGASSRVSFSFFRFYSLGFWVEECVRARGTATSSLMAYDNIRSILDSCRPDSQRMAGRMAAKRYLARRWGRARQTSLVGLDL